MCVIFVVEDQRPSELMVEQAWTRNDHGGGIAWREDHQVKWRRNLSLAEMQEACRSLPMPFIAHFRIASQGGIRPELCHPFEINRHPSAALSGSTEGSVLFHNGDWSKWQEWALNAAYRGHDPIPTGRWSDSRALAWLGSIYGHGFYEFLQEKLAIMSPTGLNLHGYGWKEIEGVVCSNDLFVPKTTGYFPGMSSYYKEVCRFGRCVKDCAPNSSYCAEHAECVVKDCHQIHVAGSPYCAKHITTTQEKKPAEGGSRSPLEVSLMRDAAKFPALTLQQATAEEQEGTLSKNALKRIRAACEKAMAKEPQPN